MSGMQKTGVVSKSIKAWCSVCRKSTQQKLVEKDGRLVYECTECGGYIG
jgi:ribosomal protein L44E